MRLIYILFIGYFLNVSCSSHENQKKPGTVAALNIPADSSASIDSVPPNKIIQETFEGMFAVSTSGNNFRECKSGKTYRILDLNNVVINAYRKTTATLSYTGESVYIKLEGYMKPSSSKKDTIVVLGLSDIKAKSFLTPCFNFEFVALGTEPFWAVEIIPAENIIVVKDVSLEKAFVFPYRKPVNKGNEYSYVTRNEKGDHLEILFRKENCNDGMSDRNYSYSCQLEINGKALTGCAVKKGDKL